MRGGGRGGNRSGIRGGNRRGRKRQGTDRKNSQRGEKVERKSRAGRDCSQTQREKDEVKNSKFGIRAARRQLWDIMRKYQELEREQREIDKAKKRRLKELYPDRYVDESDWHGDGYHGYRE